MAAEQLKYAAIAERIRVSTETVRASPDAMAWGMRTLNANAVTAPSIPGLCWKLPGAVTTEAGAGNPLQGDAASEAWAALAASKR
jgi:hypothetical protein